MKKKNILRRYYISLDEYRMIEASKKFYREWKRLLYLD